MKLHEHQAKDILAKYGVPVQKGTVAFTVGEAVAAAKNMYPGSQGDQFYVIKAQIHAGGRGKGTIRETGSRGVVVAKGLAAVEEKAKAILGGTLVTIQTGEEGKVVNRLLIAEDAFYPGSSEPKEYYLSFTLDRLTGKLVIIASAEGGMNIEDVAHNTPEKIVKEWIDPVVGLQPFQARKVAFRLGLEGEAFKNAVKFIIDLYRVYISSDLSMLEINPMLKTSDNKILAVDCKMDVDENALFRHADLGELRDPTEEDPLEVEAGEHNLNYIKLDGNVGCMVNGAGLAMATMDMIKLSGGEPANFLDVGGTADARRVEEGFRIILKDPNVKAILVNIFGGIVRCDRVASGVVEAYKNIGNISIPIIVRLQGTNAEEAARIINESGLKVTSAITLEDAAKRVKEAMQ
jgi:succinyl-CoA synthetase beta subunit